MICFAGHIRGRLRYPYIYAIAKGSCLYVGETQLHPVSRWGAHLAHDGTFMQRLREVDEDLFSSDDEIVFIGIKCERIAAIPRIEQKLVCQYVEHKVHEWCILQKPTLGYIDRIISDTINTCPRRCSYPWADETARQVFVSIRRRLTKSK